MQIAAKRLWPDDPKGYLLISGLFCEANSESFSWSDFDTCSNWRLFGPIFSLHAKHFQNPFAYARMYTSECGELEQTKEKREHLSRGGWFIHSYARRRSDASSGRWWNIMRTKRRETGSGREANAICLTSSSTFIFSVSLCEQGQWKQNCWEVHWQTVSYLLWDKH
jgi:hypothetical protein